MRIFAENQYSMNIRFISVTFLITLLSLLAISCQKTPDSIVLALSQIENCMESNPDSALTLLKQIPHPENLSGKAQADYALLMTQAMDKNYIIPASDSLISFAVGYYGSHSENSMEMGKSYFYYGRVMDGLKRDEDAMKYYLLAKNIFDDTKEYKMCGLISEKIGNLNWKQDMYENALINYKDSRKYFALANDYRCVSFALRNIGRTYLSMIGKSDSANVYYQKSLEIAHANKCGTESTILQELGLLHRVNQDYKMAEHYLLQAIDCDSRSLAKTEIYLSLGYTYLKMDDDTKAENCLKLSTNSPYIFTRIDAYNSLFRLEKSRGNLLSAIEYKENADSLSLIANDNQARTTVAELQKKYENEKLQKENLQMKVEFKNVVIFSLILFFIVVFLVCFYIYKNRITKRKIRGIERKIVDNEDEIVSCQRDIADYKKLQSESEEYQIELVTEVARLDGKVSVLTKQNNSLAKELKEMGEKKDFIPIPNSGSEESYVGAFRIYFAIRRGIFNTEISSSGWEWVFKLFDFLYSEFVARLKEEYPQLTKHDLEICCLLKIGLSNDELGKVFSTTSESVTRAKGRTKKRLNLSVEDDLEQFVSRY